MSTPVSCLSVNSLLEVAQYCTDSTRLEMSSVNKFFYRLVQSSRTSVDINCKSGWVDTINHSPLIESISLLHDGEPDDLTRFCTIIRNDGFPSLRSLSLSFVSDHTVISIVGALADHASHIAHLHLSSPSRALSFSLQSYFLSPSVSYAFQDALSRGLSRALGALELRTDDVDGLAQFFKIVDLSDALFLDRVALDSCPLQARGLELLLRSVWPRTGQRASPVPLKRLELGSLSINLTASILVPDREGMTVKGVVACDGQGVAGVVVSDGFEVTSTDADGIYYLPSEKRNGYVFISLPSGYEVECRNGNEPQFFKRLTAAAGVSEQQDFALRRVDNDHHKLFVVTDFHLANRNDDLKQYDDFVTDINATIAAETADGTPAYAIDLGDLSWDLYWYSNSFALAQCLTQADRIGCPLFHLPGNHDNDPYKADDWDAEQPFKDDVCPTYYSFNLGRVHYVLLDNVRYINTGGAEGVVGERDYEGVIVDPQMEWLRKDLSYITDPSTPIVVAMHVNLYRNPLIAGGSQLDLLSLDNGSALQSLLARFDRVEVLTGHTHLNFTVEKDNLMEHNVAAVCGTWWWTGKEGYADNYICKDGSPAGYAVWDQNGTDSQWYYKGTGEGRDYQFRTYDLNECHITAAKYAPGASASVMEPLPSRSAYFKPPTRALACPEASTSAWFWKMPSAT